MGQSSIASIDTKMLFNFTTTGLNNDQYIDLAQCLSIVNRRSYRQGMNYAVSSIEFYAASGGQVAVYKVPTTWVADNATTKAFEAWRKQRAEVLEEQPSLKAKWSDFKIFMDATHSTATSSGNLTPYSPAGAYVKGDWDSSQFVIPLPGADQANAGDAQEVHMHIVGDHTPTGNFDASTTSVGLIKAYAASRALVLAPDPVQEGQYLTGFYNIQQSDDEKSQDIMDNVSNKNDSPPYSLIEYPGSDTNAPGPLYQDLAILNDFGDDNAWSKTTVSGFLVPFGLLKLVHNLFETDTNVTCIVNMVPGNYKGVLAEKGV